MKPKIKFNQKNHYVYINLLNRNTTVYFTLTFTFKFKKLVRVQGNKKILHKTSR